MQRLDGRPRRQCTVRVAAAPRPAQNAGGWAQLPLALLHACFALLPLDSRLRAAGVCADWRAAAATLDWTRLNFNGCVAVTHKLFLAAARRACNAAVALELPTDMPEIKVHISRLVLLGVLRANATSLREVCLGDEEYTDCTLTELVKAVSHAHAVAANVRFWITHGRALPMLRNEPPYAALRLRTLNLHFNFDHEVPALMAAATAHASLRKLQVYSTFALAPALNAVVDAAVSLNLCELFIGVESVMSVAAVTAIPRLLQSEALTALTIRSRRPLGYGDPGYCLLHPSLRSISFFLNNCAHAATAAAAGSALGALIAADAPALESLNLRHCQLGDAGMSPVVAALSRNTHLRVLDIIGNDMTEPFARAHLLPALQACTTVHTIVRCGYEGCGCLDKNKLGIGQELEQLLSPRRPAGAAR